MGQPAAATIGSAGEQRPGAVVRSAKGLKLDKSANVIPDLDKESRSRDLTAKEALDHFFHQNNVNYYLAQKSEMLLFDQVKEPDEKANETFIWRKKNQKIGLDKLEPEKLLMLNKLKQEETAVRNFDS